MAFTIHFSDKDKDIELALLKMSLDTQRSKNQLVKFSLIDYLKSSGYLNEKGNYETN